jgi:signal transduction histidine kinase
MSPLQLLGRVVALPSADSTVHDEGDDGMVQWRAAFLDTILRYSLFFGLLVGLPSVGFAVRDGMWLVVALDCVVLGILMLVWCQRAWPYRVRAWCLVGMVYVLGVGLLFKVGPVSQIYLMACPLLVSLLLGLRWSIVALVVNVLTLLSVGYLADGDLLLPGFDHMPLLKWSIITLNFGFVDAMITVACALMLRRLEASVQRQTAVTLSLRAERQSLRDANQQLQLQTEVRRHAQEEVRLLNNVLEERVRQRTAQLEAANRELEAFSYTVSHDLRSPLRSIHGFSRLLASELGSGVAEPVRHSLERLQANAAHMSELIEALLGLARLSRTPMRWQTVDLAAIAREVVVDCRERDPERAIRLIIPQHLPVQGDAALLRVVLDNLLGNAWKFSSRKALSEIELGSSMQPGGAPCYFVRDNGAGFDMSRAAKLFGTFERLHSAADFAGTGIGLATVQRIVERHGGRVWAHSAIDEGASFYFSLGATAPLDLQEQGNGKELVLAPTEDDVSGLLPGEDTMDAAAVIRLPAANTTRSRSEHGHQGLGP